MRSNLSMIALASHVAEGNIGFGQRYHVLPATEHKIRLGGGMDWLAGINILLRLKGAF